MDPPSPYENQSLIPESDLRGMIKACSQTLSAGKQESVLLALGDASRAIDQLQPTTSPIIDRIIYEDVKPLSRQITNYNSPSFECTLALQKTLLSIVKLYCRTFIESQNINALETLKELICRDTAIFKKNTISEGNRIPAGAPAAHQGFRSVDSSHKNEGSTSNKSGPQVQKKQGSTASESFELKKPTFEWAAETYGHTQFHRSCCELIFSRICTDFKQFQRRKLISFLEAAKLIDEIRYQMISNQRIAMGLQLLEAYESICNDPSKQHLKEATSSMLFSLASCITSLLRGIDLSAHQFKQLEKKLYFYAPHFCLNFLSHQCSIDSKILAIKILNSITDSIYYRRLETRVIAEEQFCQWLIDNRLWDLLFSKNSEATIVNASEYICKLMIGSGKITDQKYKQFLNLIWEVKPELKFAYMKVIDPYRMRDRYINVIVEDFSIIRPAELYTEQFFELCEGFAKYNTNKITNQFLKIVVEITLKHYDAFKEYQIKRRSLEAIKFIFERTLDIMINPKDKVMKFVTDIYDLFHYSPNHITLSIVRKIYEIEYGRGITVDAAKFLIEEKKFIEKVIELLEVEGLTFKKQLLYLFNSVMSKYKEASILNKPQALVPTEVIVKSSKHPQVFRQIIDHCSNAVCEQIFLYQIQLLKKEYIEFECVKHVFYKINGENIEELKAEYCRPSEHLVKCDPNKMIGVNELMTILHQAKLPVTQEQCAELIAHLYTTFSDDFIEQGRAKSIECMRIFLKQLDEFSTALDINGASQNEQTIKSTYGKLCLLRQMLTATETEGVGNLKAHDSLIATSTVHVTVWNNASYGDDVLKCFEKNLPSNMTLYDLLGEVGEAFKRGAHQLIIQEGDQMAIPRKYNGYTLQNLRLHNRTFNAYKTDIVRAQKVKLRKDNGDLNEQYLNVLKEIFQYFCDSNRRMGKVEISKYIEGATNSVCWASDTRITTLLNEYDSDKDELLTLQDFVKFYADNTDGSEKEENVWTNLMNLHYRKDLKKFNDPIEPIRPELLFRSYLQGHKSIYKLLFDLSNHSVRKISEITKEILVHLPTCRDIIDMYLEHLDFKGRKAFQISYILISVRYLLSNDKMKADPSNRVIQCQPQAEDKTSKMPSQGQQVNQQLQAKSQIELDDQDSHIEEEKTIEETRLQIEVQESEKKYTSLFLQRKHEFKIYELLVSIHSSPQQSEEEQALEAICLNILRFLLKFPNLAEENQNLSYDAIHQQNTQIYELKIPKNSFFLEIAKKSLQNSNISVFESALALTILQHQIETDWIQEGIFHDDKNIRAITLRFLLTWSCRYNFPINFFELGIVSRKANCHQWYYLLAATIDLNKKLDLEIIGSNILFELADSGQELQTISEGFNPTLNGNLFLLKAICQIDSDLLKNLGIYQMIEELLKRTFSSENRSQIYLLMARVNPDQALKYLFNLIKNTPPTEVYQPRYKFVGIKNLGSTCYMNSIIQQFFMIKKFRRFVLDCPVNTSIPETEVKQTKIVDDFFYQLQKMYSYLQGSQKKFFHPLQFCLSNKDFDGQPINPVIQEDAHEFLNKMFYEVEEHAKKEGKVSDLERIFQGKTTCEIKCAECQSTKQKVEDFYHLTVEVKNSSTLDESFEKFIAPEQIQDYFCETCDKKSSKITKQTLISQSPEFLIVNLQRIVFDLSTYEKVKVHSRLSFSDVFELGPFMCHSTQNLTSSQYSLKGVVIHSGTSQGGHYYSIIRVNQEWFKFNDDTVSKFDRSDLERQAFGGSDTTDGMGDYSYSTNAYILFYEKTALEPEQIIAEQCLSKTNQTQILGISEPFKSQIQQQTNMFKAELQLHQQSYFQTINVLYGQVRPTQVVENQAFNTMAFYEEWKNLPNRTYLEEFFEIYMEISRFIVYFNNIKQETLYYIGTAIFQLLALLPQKSYPFLMNFDFKLWLEVLCTHNNATVRQLYKVVLNKAVAVYDAYYGIPFDANSLETQRIHSVFETFFQAIDSDLVSKNVFKSNYFFEFWRISIENSPSIRQICLKNEMMGSILDLLMANESPFANPDKKRQEFSTEVSIPLVQIVNRLLDRKLNLQGQCIICENGLKQQVCELTQKQKRILSSYEFYRRMMKLRYDNGMLAKIIVFMSYKDAKISKTLSRLFLIGLNRLEEVNDTNALLNVPQVISIQNIKHFLLINDEHQKQRAHWILGIPQYEEVSASQYCLRYSTDSSYMVYVSSLYFARDQRYKPALEVLHSKRSYFTDFETNGILTLLELMSQVDVVLEHVISIPPPCKPGTIVGYQHKNYLTWIGQYIYKLRNEPQYGLSADKNMIAEKMEFFIEKISKKLSMSDLSQIEFPVQKKIIGKNSKFTTQAPLKAEAFSITRRVHETFVMNNLPTDQGANQSLTQERFQSLQGSLYSKLFISDKEPLPQIEVSELPQNVDCLQSVDSLEIQTQRPLLLTFKQPIVFPYQIYIAPGQIVINLPHIAKDLAEVVSVQVVEDSDSHFREENGEEMKMKEPSKQSEAMATEQWQYNMAMATEHWHDSTQVPNNLGSTSMVEIQCPRCTYINFGRTSCEVCEQKFGIS